MITWAENITPNSKKQTKPQETMLARGLQRKRGKISKKIHGGYSEPKKKKLLIFNKGKKTNPIQFFFRISLDPP